MSDATDETANGTERIVDRLRSTGLSSRRGFLQRSAALGGAALVLSVGGANRALAHDADDDETSDVDVLNFALTLEHLEYAFYRDGLDRFDEEDFEESETLERFSEEVRSEVRPNLRDIRDHEEDHVETLTDVVESLDGDPVAEACYEFGVDDVDEFLAVAALLENTGVSAYDGAISLIEAANLLTAGATIATVEARHASYLNVLVGDDPFPESFDTTRTMDEVLDAAGGFIVDCETADDRLSVSVDCDVDDPAKVTVTNVSGRTVELRDIDSEGVNAVNGRPVLAPGESYSRTRVRNGTAVLAAYDPETDEQLGDVLRVDVNCA